MLCNKSHAFALAEMSTYLYKSHALTTYLYMNEIVFISVGYNIFHEGSSPDILYTQYTNVLIEK
ncbi:hypothetical protein GQX74_013439 [Glossina fuscipes]|nr:hypothetical protein GQX74_013439 [Glossina fuscipes]